MDNDLSIHTGVVERWVRVPDTKGFGILMLERRPVPYIGTFKNDIGVGDQVAFVVKLATHARYGEQAKVQRTVMHLPGEYNFARWLLTRLPNIGPVRAAQLQQMFGDRIWNVIADDPMQLTEIDGITEVRAREIAAAYQFEKLTVELYQKLIRLGVDPKVIMTLIRKEIPLPTLQHYIDTDPYQMLTYAGITFRHCDEIGDRLGIGKTDRRRIRGFVVSLLRDARADGSTIVHMNRVKQEARATLRVDEKTLFEALGPEPEEEIEAARQGGKYYPPQYVFFGKYVQWRELADAEAALIKVLRGEHVNGDFLEV